MPLQATFRCAECERIFRELRAAFLLDAKEVGERLRRTAESSGQEVERFRTAWVQSVAKMPEQEMLTLLRAHYPGAIETRRQKAEHEAATGHSVRLHGWRGATLT
jgi:hypothetical protein